MATEKRVKIWNRSKGHHDFVYQDANRKTPIPPGASAYVPLDEFYYVNTSSKSFSKGILELDPSEKKLIEETGYLKRTANVFTEAEIYEILLGDLNTINEKLGDATELHAFTKIVDVARTMDLTYSKIKAIQKLTKMKVYDDIFEEDEVEKVQVKTKKNN